jgi:hypothetical protein
MHFLNLARKLLDRGDEQLIFKGCAMSAADMIKGLRHEVATPNAQQGGLATGTFAPKNATTHYTADPLDFMAMIQQHAAQKSQGAPTERVPLKPKEKEEERIDSSAHEAQDVAIATPKVNLKEAEPVVEQAQMVDATMELLLAAAQEGLDADQALERLLAQAAAQGVEATQIDPAIAALALAMQVRDGHAPETVNPEETVVRDAQASLQGTEEASIDINTNANTNANNTDSNFNFNADTDALVMPAVPEVPVYATPLQQLAALQHEVAQAPNMPDKVESRTDIFVASIAKQGVFDSNLPPEGSTEDAEVTPVSLLEQHMNVEQDGERKETMDMDQGKATTSSWANKDAATKAGLSAFEEVLNPVEFMTDSSSTTMAQATQGHNATSSAQGLQARPHQHYVLPQPAPIAEVPQHIRVVAASLMPGEKATMTVQISPPQLGKVDITVEHSADGRTIDVVIAAGKHTAVQLEQDIQQLRQHFDDKGYDSKFSFEQRDEGQQQDRQHKQASSPYHDAKKEIEVDLNALMAQVWPQPGMVSGSMNMRV